MSEAESALRATAVSRPHGFADTVLPATDDEAVTRAFDLADTVAKLCWRLSR